MAATYDLSAGFTDLTRVRFHTGDTNLDATAFSDEEINAVITEQGTWKKAVIALIESQIARLASTPDFQADWLRVSATSAIKSYEALLKRKRLELGVSQSVVSMGYVFRPDMGQTESPDYESVEES